VQVRHADGGGRLARIDAQTAVMEFFAASVRRRKASVPDADTGEQSALALDANVHGGHAGGGDWASIWKNFWAIILAATPPIIGGFVNGSARRKYLDAMRASERAMR